MNLKPIVEEDDEPAIIEKPKPVITQIKTHENTTAVQVNKVTNPAMTLQEELDAKRKEMAARASVAQKQVEEEEDDDPPPAGEFEYKMWCNKRNAEGLPIKPRPGPGG